MMVIAVIGIGVAILSLLVGEMVIDLIDGKYHPVRWAEEQWTTFKTRS